MPLDMALSDYLKAHHSIGSHDRRFLGDTAYALVRWKGLLDYLLARELSPKNLWSDRYALWQRLDFKNLPEDAPLWVRSGASEWLFNEIALSHGQARARELCLALNVPAPLTIRTNTFKTTRENLLALFPEAVACKDAPQGLRFPQRIPLTATPQFKEGFFEIQDEGSQLVADLVQPRPGDQILDYCSGSGGKTLAIAPKMQGRGQIYLHDIRPTILYQAKKRLRRAGIQNAQFLPPDHPRLPSLKNQLHWVLADVPCSGSGTYRRNPDMKWKMNAASLENLVKEQRDIFQKALEFVRPGGFIVYATCSLFAKENEEQVKYFLDTFPVELQKQLSLLPDHPEGPDGFFAAVFLNKNNSAKLST